MEQLEHISVLKSEKIWFVKQFQFMKFCYRIRSEVTDQLK